MSAVAKPRVHIKETVTVEVGISSFDDDAIAAEFEARGLSSPLTEDCDRLAELIAAGETDRALDTLKSMAPDMLSPATVKRLITDRARHSARLF